MNKKNKFLASSLAPLTMVSLASTANNNVKAAFNISQYALNLLGNLEWFRKLFKSLYTGLNEYKYSDIVLDPLGYTGLAQPKREGETVECEGVTLVAKKIGSEENNILMWRAESKTKPGKSVYICDKQTWEEEIFGKYCEKEKNTPEYVNFFIKLLEDKRNKFFKGEKIDNVTVLKENGFDGLCKSFEEKVKQAKYLCKVEEILSSKSADIQYDEFWDFEGKLGLPVPEHTGDKIAIVTTDEGVQKFKENKINKLELGDFCELTALKVNGKWYWVYYETTENEEIKKVVCFHLGGEKPAGEKTPIINLDEKKLLKLLPKFKTYLKRRNVYLEQSGKNLKSENGFFNPPSMGSWLNSGWYESNVLM